MKILSQLWKAFKGADVNPSGWIVHQAKWDPKNKLYIVGDLSVPDGPPDPLDPRNRTIDSGDIPPNWHQCFYYHENLTNEVTGSHSWIRCRNLAGPGLKPSFCLLHAEQELRLHKKTEVIKKQPLVEDKFKWVYCKHGSCIERVQGDDYCPEHEPLYVPGAVSNPNPFLEEEECGCYGYCEKHFNGGQERSQEDIDFEAIVEDVDWVYCQKIGWGQLRYRRNRKTIPMQQQETVHFKLELRGNRDDIDLFHAIVHLCDSDYPLDPFRKNTQHPELCTNCGGFVWTNAIVTAPDLKKAARQAGLKGIKIRTYMPESTCKKKDRAASA